MVLAGAAAERGGIRLMDKAWDHATDVLVVGSGGGGMTAALAARDCGAEALVIEKGRLYGGSTAMSGGSIWVPCNHLAGQAGLADSPDEALAYLAAVTAGRVPGERLQSYVSAAPEMVRYLEEKSRVHFQLVAGYSDYYPGLPGSRPGGGRTIEAVPLNAGKLGPHRAQMQPLPCQARLLGRMMATAGEAHRMVDSSLRGRAVAAGIVGAYLLNPFRCLARTDTRLTLGNALIGRLRLSLADRGVGLWLDTAGERLVVEGGRVAGVEAVRAGQALRIRARKGVILAAGGFARDRAMREQYQRPPVSDAWTVACPEDRGDAIRMGLEAGARVDLMDDAWWMPTSVAPGAEMPFMSIVDRSLPGCMIVNRRGRRFTNEAAPYIDVVKSQYASHARGEEAIPASFIMDARFRRKYPAGPLMPGTSGRQFVASGYLKVADTIEGLAAKCGIDPEGLADEVKKLNGYAATGRDLGFHKGEAAIDRFYADPSVRPNPCLAPLDTPPYSAFELWPGDLGTKGGLVTDSQARVLGRDGAPMDGLYATGNCSASVMGHSYAGAGATIGPSMVFGYIAARRAAGA